MRSMRNRQTIKINSMLTLGLLVLLGVILTTLAQAAELSSPFATRENTSWLNAMQVSGDNGLYRMQLRGTLGEQGPNSDRDTSTDMSVGLGFQTEQAGVVDSPVDDFRGFPSGLHPVVVAGPLLFISVGQHW